MHDLPRTGLSCLMALCLALVYVLFTFFQFLPYPYWVGLTFLDFQRLNSLRLWWGLYGWTYFTSLWIS